MAIIRAEQITIFITDDDPVIARMAAAVDVVEAAGMTFEAADDARADAAGAAHWQRYGRGQLSNVHRACGRDIARGSLRLWHSST